MLAAVPSIMGDRGRGAAACDIDCSASAVSDHMNSEIPKTPVSDNSKSQEFEADVESVSRRESLTNFRTHPVNGQTVQVISLMYWNRVSVDLRRDAIGS